MREKILKILQREMIGIVHAQTLASAADEIEGLMEKERRATKKAVQTALDFMDGTNSDRYLARTTLEKLLEKNK